MVDREHNYIIHPNLFFLVCDNIDVQRLFIFFIYVLFVLMYRIVEVGLLHALLYVFSVKIDASKQGNSSPATNVNSPDVIAESARGKYTTPTTLTLVSFACWKG